MEIIKQFVFLVTIMWIVNILSIIVESGRNGFMQESFSYLRKWLSPAFALYYIVFFIIDSPNEFVQNLSLTFIVIACVSFFAATVDDVLLFFTDNLASQLVITISRLVVIIIALFICASEVWNIDLAEISTAMGLVTLGISLSFQTIMSDLFAGVTTALSGNINLYETVLIKLDDGSEIEGAVTEIGWRYLYVSTEDDKLVTIPHSRLNSAVIERVNM